MPNSLAVEKQSRAQNKIAGSSVKVARERNLGQPLILRRPPSRLIKVRPPKNANENRRFILVLNCKLIDRKGKTIELPQTGHYPLRRLIRDD